MRTLCGAFCLAVALVPAALAQSRAGEAPLIRVAILKGQRSLDIRAGDLVIRDLASFRTIVNSGTPVRAIITAEGGRMRIQGSVYRTSLISVSTSGSVIAINERTYRGKLEVAVGRDGHLTIINELDLEKYLVGLINHEISSSWNMEAVKAQAIVARTYALFQRSQRQEDFYDLESTVLDQVYGGSILEDERARRAVEETRGIIITYNGKPIRALYHSCCGGRTESSRYFTGEDLPYLEGVSCPFCRNAPNFFWIYSISLDKLSRSLNAAGFISGRITSLSVARRSPSTRAVEFAVVAGSRTTKVPGETIRRIVGYDRLKSLMIKLTVKNGEAVFMGSGAGHGVGLCQWGMKGMADKGYRSAQILSYYYPGTHLAKAY